MTRNIIIAILILAAILFLAYYYKASSLNLERKGLILKVKEKTLTFEATRTKTTPIVFSNVDIMQSKLSDGTYFEVATCEPLYEFNSNQNELVKVLFDASKVEDVFSIRGVSAMSVTLQNAQIIHLLMDDNDPKELRFVYGMSDEVFSQTVKTIMGAKSKALPVGGIFELPAPVTQWSVINNDFNGIIVSIDH